MEDKKDKKSAPINVVDIAKKLWPHRKTYFKVLPATLVITYLIIVCIPRYYSCTVSLAPEPTGASSMSGSLGSLASSFGLGSLSKLGSQDALFSEIYPDILKSNDFISQLMTVKITTKDNETTCNYYTYLRDKQKEAWWNTVIGSIRNMISIPDQDTYNGEEILDVFYLTKTQSDIFNAASSKISSSIDKKTDVVSITVKDQDPLVCATMANETCKKLQDFIIAYRTNKAHIDHDYYEKLVAEAKESYEKARQQYVLFADSHQDAFLPSYKTKEEGLENEMQLRYNVYTAMSNQLQAATAKLQEATPAFTVIQSASVPVKPAGPKRVVTAVFMTILAFIIISAKILLKESYQKTEKKSE